VQRRTRAPAGRAWERRAARALPNDAHRADAAAPRADGSQFNADGTGDLLQV
jgi:hypothetical protein